MSKGLNAELTEKLREYGELQFSFEDTLLALDLEAADKEVVKQAHTWYEKGRLAGELEIGKTLFKQAKGGNVGAGKELLQTIKKDSSQKKTLPSR